MNEVPLLTRSNALIVLLLVAVTLSALAFVMWVLFRQRNELKAFMTDFPTQGGGVVVALTLIFFTGLVVIVRLALGAKFPDNYDNWIWALVALAGVTTAGMVGKRATSIEYRQAGAAKASTDAPAAKPSESEEPGAG